MKIANRCLVLLAPVVVLAACVLALQSPASGTIKPGMKSGSETAAMAERGESRGLDYQGGPDAFGYRYVDNQSGDTATYNWIELRGDAVATWLQFGDNSDDAVMTNVPIGFGFPFYGATYTTMRVSTNGNLQFTTTTAAYENLCLPTTELAAPLICPFWDDLNLDMGGYDPGGNITVGFRNFGDYFVIEYDSVGRWGDVASFKFEAILWADGRIKFQYNHLVWGEGAQSQTIGIQSGSGSGLQYVCDADGHQAVQNLAVLFYLGSSGMVTGVVRDQNGDPVANAWVSVSQLGVSAMTDPTGDYTLPNIPEGSYVFAATRPCCYTGSEATISVIAGQTTTHDFVITWNGVYPFTSTNVPVVVADGSTVTSNLAVTENIEIADLNVMFTILHTSAEDLRISLTSPSQTTVILSDQNGENYEDNYLWTVLDDEATTALRDGSPPFTGSFRPDNPLSAFDGESTQGAWTLTIEDLIAGDDGELTYWEIQVSTPGAADDEVLPAGVRHFALTGSYPNPFNSSTRIHYVAPRTGPVALSLYNVLGQKIVTLFNGSVAAGSHHVMWDGRDGAGRDAATGLYIVRLVAPGETSTGKVVLIR